MVCSSETGFHGETYLRRDSFGDQPGTDDSLNRLGFEVQDTAPTRGEMTLAQSKGAPPACRPSYYCLSHQTIYSVLPLLESANEVKRPKALH